MTSYFVDKEPLTFFKLSKHEIKLSLMLFMISVLFYGDWLSFKDFMSYLMRKRSAYNIRPGFLLSCPLNFWLSNRVKGSFPEKILLSTIFRAISLFFSLRPPTSESAACMLLKSSLLSILSMVGWLGAVEKWTTFLLISPKIGLFMIVYEILSNVLMPSPP